MADLNIRTCKYDIFWELRVKKLQFRIQCTYVRIYTILHGIVQQHLFVYVCSCSPPSPFGHELLVMTSFSHCICHFICNQLTASEMMWQAYAKYLQQLFKLDKDFKDTYLLWNGVLDEADPWDGLVTPDSEYCTLIPLQQARWGNVNKHASQLQSLEGPIAAPFADLHIRRRWACPWIRLCTVHGVESMAKYVWIILLRMPAGILL